MTTGKKWLIGCSTAAGAAILLAAIAAVIALSVGRSFTSRVDSFFKLAAAGNTEAAYEQCTSDVFKKNTPKADLLSFLSKMGASKYSHSSMSSFKSTTALCKWEGAIIQKGGTAIPVSVTFVKERGEWRIMGITIKE